jgi:rhamnogalacturonyl hydrolase YesR
LATEVPAGEDPRNYINESGEIRQLHYNGGIAAACLVHLYMATGERRWIDLAKKFQKFSMETTEGQFQTKQVCKSAWGSGLITLATRDNSYRSWLIKMGDWFTAEQEPDGRWSNTRTIEEHPPLAHQIEITAEFVVHVDTVIAALSAIDARN